MDCKTCKEHRAEPVPYIVHEAAEARAERHIKRLIIALVVSVVLLFASNAMWLWAWMQYDFEDETGTFSVDVDAGEGIANYIGQDGDIVNGSNQGD